MFMSACSSAWCWIQSARGNPQMMMRSATVVVRGLALGLTFLLAVTSGAWAQHDLDSDLLLDDFDNCIYNANLDQQDRDGDNTGDVCDSCPDDFNAGQSDVDGNGIGDVCDSAPPTALTLTRVQLKATRPHAPTGTIVVQGLLDVTGLGGIQGFSDALRRGLAVGVTGAGLPSAEAIYFPPCVSIAYCSTEGELPAHPVHRVIDAGSPLGSVGFLRKGSTNLFAMKMTVRERSFQPPLSAAGVKVGLSVGTFSFGTLYFGGIDFGAASNRCTVRSKGKTVTCR